MQNRPAPTDQPAPTPSSLLRESPPQPPSFRKNEMPEGCFAALDHNGLVIALKVEYGSGKFAGTMFVMSRRTPESQWGHAGSKKPNGRYMGYYADALAIIRRDPEASRLEYGDSFGRCGRCDGPLAAGQRIHPPCARALAARAPVPHTGEEG